MKVLDVVNQLRLVLPKYTNKFSDVISIASIVASGGDATITTSSAHGLTTGDAATIAGVDVQTSIDSVSKDGLVYTFGTDEDHDLTEGWEEHETVTFDGFTDGDWNDSFTLLAVPNRRTFKVRSTNSEPSLNDNEVLFENRVDGVNGFYSVTVISPTVFEITRTQYPIKDGAYTGGTVSKDARIGPSATVERAKEQYTKMNTDELWMFVVMHDPETSKDRAALSDAIATPANGVDIRLRLIDGFTCFIFVRTTDEIAGEISIDVCRDELLTPMLKSLYGVLFPNNLATGPEFKAIPSSHGIVDYDKAVLVYGYEFQVSMDVTDFDAVEPSDTRAFRDVEYEQRIDPEKTGVYPLENMEVDIDLDDEPIEA